MEFIPVAVDEIPAGRTGDTTTQNYLQGFLEATDEQGNPVMGAQITLSEGESVDNARSKVQASIDKNEFPIRVVSSTNDGVTTLFIKRDESAVEAIRSRKAKRQAALEAAKAQRKAEKEAAKANGSESTEAPVEAEVTPEPVVEAEVESAPRGRRGR
jgi:hypothetical protein